MNRIPDEQWDEEFGCLHQPLGPADDDGNILCRWCFAIGKAHSGSVLAVEWNVDTEPTNQDQGR